MQASIFTVSIVTALVLILLTSFGAKRRRRDDLKDDLEALPILRLTQLRHELTVREEACYADSAQRNSDGPFAHLPMQLLIVELKLEAMRLGDMFYRLRLKHHMQIPQLRRKFDAILAEVLDQNRFVRSLLSRLDQTAALDRHHARCRAEAEARVQRNQKVRNYLTVVRILLRNAHAEAEYAFSDLKAGRFDH